jgi:hypothetical protein
MPSKKKNKNMPKDGWVEELREAEAQAKADNSTSAEPHLRVARAARKLRLWKKCKSAAETGLSISPEGPLRAQLVECQKQADEQLSSKSSIDHEYEEVLNAIKDGLAQSVDIIPSSSPTFNNLNILQAAVLQGDVRVFEEVVALGAAIDYPVLTESQNDPNLSETISPAPPGTTALVMCCATLALYGKVDDPQFLPVDLKRMLDGILECAILLVQLGADCQKKFNFPGNHRRQPPHSSQDFQALSVYRQLGLNGKTAQQIAKLSKKEDLIKVMAEFENKEKKMAATICRCGSRLPWRQCHVGKRFGESPIFMEEKGKLMWRYSPIAPCFCNQEPKKIHFNCCWIETSTPRYQDDDTGCLKGTNKIAAANMPPGAMYEIAEMLKFRKEESGGDPRAKVFVDRDADGVPTGRAMNAKMLRDQQVEAIRFDGGSMFKEIMRSKYTGVRNRVHDMDPDVFAGCLERIDNGFFWTDVHWEIEKAELLIRVKEWNEALNKFCDDRRLTGSKRKSTIEKHQATPYAPCGNPRCNKVETKVKEYLKCSRCKAIAFCSRECQRDAWTIHKKSCIPA